MPFGPLAKRFRRNDRGAAALVFALSIFVLLGMAGAAIDFARWHDAHGVSETAIDAALLAGARRMQVAPDESQSAIDAAQSYYTSKTRAYSGIVDDTVKFVLDNNGAAIRATGTSYLKTSMLGILGIERLQIASPARAAFPKGGGSNVEVCPHARFHRLDVRRRRRPLCIQHQRRRVEGRGQRLRQHSHSRYAVHPNDARGAGAVCDPRSPDFIRRWRPDEKGDQSRPAVVRLEGRMRHEYRRRRYGRIGQATGPAPRTSRYK